MAEIIRVARDSDAVVVKTGDNQFTLVTEDFQVLEPASSLLKLSLVPEAKRTWRSPTKEDATKYAKHIALAAGEVAEVAPTNERAIRLPKAMQRAITDNLETFAHDEEVYNRLKELSTRTSTTVSEVAWLSDLIESAHNRFAALGGETATTWFDKINRSGPITAAGAFEADEALEYFGTAEEEGAEKLTGLISVDRDEDVVSVWQDGGFTPTTESVDTYEAGTVVEIDAEDAAVLAEWIDSTEREDPEGVSFSEQDPAEANLFASAEAGIDWEDLDNFAALVADATGYSSPERAKDAEKQQRKNNGDFGPSSDSEEESDTPNPFAKATLAEGAEVLTAPADVINDGEEHYFAAVEPDAPTEVLDLFHFYTSGEDYAADARRDGEWVEAPEMVDAVLSGDAPALVEVSADQVESVTTSVDAYDEASGEEVEDDATDEDGFGEESDFYGMYGSHGEILPEAVVAAGIPGVADTASDKAAANRLKRYWAFGKGTLKWRPGTPGDLTRLRNQLAKYVGPDRAWGLAQNIHKMRFGVTNATRDKAAGER